MEIIIQGEHHNVAVVRSDGILIADAQSALDLAMEVSHETGIYSLVFPKACLAKDFFILSSNLAGEVLQKYINYGIKLAVWGDFSCYRSKPLHDFIRESNQGRDFFFVSDESEAVEKLTAVTESFSRRPVKNV